LHKLIFTVTNDLTYDQRMHRICASLANAGYEVLLVGRKLTSSIPVKQELYQQKRIKCFFKKGPLMYLEFNIKLFFLLLSKPASCNCAIDLDTILPNLIVSTIKKQIRVYDAHELFTEQKEIVTRPAIQKVWLAIEKFAVPKFKWGYTVNDFIAEEFKQRYGANYCVVRNLPLLTPLLAINSSKNAFILYQGAVNEGRSFETLIPAMKEVNAKLVICGNGNFFNKALQLIEEQRLKEKVELRGMVPPEELKKITPTAHVAVMLFEEVGLNQYHSLANRFFDYIMAGVPQVCVNYPQYKAINDEYNIASLIDNTKTETIATALNNLLQNTVYHNTLRQNCLKAREFLNWESEEKVLISFYNKLFSN
jgi:glycosyltransferase involved in cell wall biosynthesis